MKKWEQLQLALKDSKSKRGQSDIIRIKHKIRSRQSEFELLNNIVDFAQKGPVR